MLPLNPKSTYLPLRPPHRYLPSAIFITLFLWLLLAAGAYALTLANNQAASLVLGQPNFTTSTSATSQTKMDGPTDVAVDPTTGKVFVAEFNNHRVLRFASGADLANGAAAEAVLGQTNFTNDNSNTAQNRMDGPTGIYVDAAGRLWVADRFNHRILRFDNASTLTSGANASGVLGQTNFTNNSSATSQSRLDEPVGVYVDSAGNLWVADQENDRVLRFNNAAAKANGANADGVLGQANFTGNSAGTAQNRMDKPGGVYVDVSGRLWVAERENDRVLRFDNAAAKANGANADGVLGQANFTSSSAATAQNRMDQPTGVSGDASGRLYVAEFDNNRVIWFNNAAAKANGANADGVLGQANFTSNTTDSGGLSASSLDNPFHLFYDSLTDALWLADFGNNRVLRQGGPPDVEVLGNSVAIATGDTTPAAADHTDFGNVSLGQALTRTFTIRNNGGSNLLLTGSPYVTITGAAALDFSLVVSPTTPITANTTTTFQVRFNPSVIGTRAATLTIANNDTNENPYTFAIQGSGVNQAPVANAGADQSVLTSALVTLNGSGSSDPDNHLPLTFGWTQTGGPAVTLSNATASQPTFTAPATPTVLTFTLTVTDALGLADATPDQVVVTVTGLVGHWKFDEGSGTTAADSSGLGNNGALANGPTWSTGGGPTTFSNPASVNLDGSNDHVQLPASFSNTTDFTFAGWVFWRGGGNWQRIFDFGQNTTFNMFLTPQSGSNTLRFAITTGGGGAEQRLNTTTLPTNRWGHVAVTLNGNTGVLYVDGVARDTQTITLNPNQVIGANTWLGRSQYADPFLNGCLDEVRVYNRGLSAGEIATLSLTTTLNLSASNNSPTALGNTTTLTATNNVGCLSYQWNFGDGTPTGSGQSVNHTYTAPGTYTAVVTTTHGSSAVTATTVVIITAPEMTVLGNDQVITTGDTSPSLTDHTDFGSVLAANGAITRTFTISNSGDLDLNLTGSPVVSITGPAAGDFTLVSGPTTPVGTASTTTFEVRFDPSVVGTRSATLTVANNDPNENPYTFAVQGEGIIPTIQFSQAGPYSDSEEVGTSNTVTLSRSGDTSYTSTVQVSLTGGTAASGGVDYNDSGFPLTVNFVPGEVSQTVPVPVVDDLLDENTEDITFQIAAGSNTDLGPITTASLQIVDNDNPPTISIDDVTVTEGTGGAVDAVFTLSLSGASGLPISLEYATTDGAAIAPADYTTSPTTTLPFAPGVTTQTVTVTVQSDALDEADETFLINLANTTNATILDSQGVGTISDDDDPPAVTLALTDSPLAENGGEATVTAELSAISGRSVTVNLGFSGTAASLNDYTASSAFILIPAGNLTGAITLTAQDDSLDEADETINVAIDTVVNGTENDPQQVIATITDDDASPSLSIDNVNTDEAGGTTSFTVSLSAVSGLDVGVDYSTANGTAVAGGDYTALSTATLIIPAGNLTGTITVNLTDDTLDEDDETFLVNLGSPVNATLSDDQGLGTILDDDASPLLTINDVSVSEAAGSASFTLSLNAVSGRDISLNYSTLDGTASAGSDYTDLSAVLLTVPTGDLTATVTISILEDLIDEADETFFVSLSSGVNVTISDNLGQGTILDNDAAGISVAPTSLTIAEPNSSATFAIALTSEPTATVTINLSSSDPTECVVPASINLTSLTWQAGVSVTVTAVDDQISDGSQLCTVQTTASSSDLNYNGRNPENVDVTVQDNDTADILISQTQGLTTTETGGAATFTVVLQTEPTATVTVTLTSADATEGGSSPASLIFTPLNWNVAQTVTVTGVNDDEDDGDIAYTIQTGPAASSDPVYNNFDPVDVSLTNLDDDTAGVIVSAISGNTEESGLPATFTIRLTSQPTAEVTIPINSSDTTEGTVSPISLIFSPLDWNVPQTVTVTGVDDLDLDGDIAYTIQTNLATDSADPLYAKQTPVNVAVVNLDNEALAPPVVPIYLPIITVRAVSLPDLVVDNLSANGGNVSVTIRNAGNAAVVDAFWVDVYLNPTTRPSRVNQRWQDVGKQGLVWGVKGAALPLEPGETLTLTLGDAYYFASLSNFTTPVAVGSSVYAQVDSVNLLTNYGGVQENHEVKGEPYNNISHISVTAAITAAASSGEVASASGSAMPSR